MARIVRVRIGPQPFAALSDRVGLGDTVAQRRTRVRSFTDSLGVTDTRVVDETDAPPPTGGFGNLAFGTTPFGGQ